MSKFFHLYGSFCANHPWEVIVAVITLTTCLLTVEQHHNVVPTPKKIPNCIGCVDEFNAPDIVVMTLIRCLAILYSYHQFRNMQRIGSKYILGIAGLFTVFSSFVFTSTVLNLLKIDLVDLKDALFFFLLLIDLSKAATLAQFALTASNQEEISSKISRGMSILGPTITLDSLVEILVIGVGTLSGVQRLEMLSYFACLSVLVNYIIFMTFYPACLSLMLELSHVSNFYGENRNQVTKMLVEENQKSNPAVQRVKLIMSIGLMVVHLYSYWSFVDDSSEVKGNVTSEATTNNNKSESSTTTYYSYIMKQFALSTDHLVILILLLTLMVKFIFFESKDGQINNSDARILQELDAELLKKRQHIRKVTESVEIQTDLVLCEDPTTYTNYIQPPALNLINSDSSTQRNLEECLQIFRSENIKNGGANALRDEEIMLLVDTKHIPAYNLEKAVKNPERGVKIRRKIIENVTNCAPRTFNNLPYENYDYSKVMGACCENVIGYVPVPLGVAGPLLLDEKLFYIPMATTEGCLIASTNRGCRAVEKSGIKSRIVADGMTRGPVVRFTSVTKASEVLIWVEKPSNFTLIKEQFDSTSRFARLKKITTRIAARYLFMRFVAETGDAMGMNMISKGTEKSLNFLQTKFPDMQVLSLSGNFCMDKKPSAINWIEGRGKSVVCESIIPSNIVKSTLKTSTQALVDLNISKNLIGSAVAGSIGGFNAHASNIVTAIFIATGQDPAQNVASSNCITIMEPWGERGEDLYVSCTMPSVEIGTIGGGTILPAQSACLELLGVKGPHEKEPGENAKQLAKIVCGAVLAGEVSLMAALTSGQLVRSHLKYNRSYSEGGTDGSKFSSLSRDDSTASTSVGSTTACKT